MVLEILAKEIEIILQPREKKIFEENDQTPKFQFLLALMEVEKQQLLAKLQVK